MNLTQRTIRITLASVVATILATYLGLQSPMSAGIVALLSVLDTRLKTIETALQRFLSTVLAFIISAVIFPIFGFSVYSFGLFLAILIPLANLVKVEAGIVPSSVLVTQFILAESVDWSLQFNGLLLMTIGLVFALLLNLWIPSYDKKLEEHVHEIEKQMSLILFLFENRLAEGRGSLKRIESELQDLLNYIKALDQLALMEYENRHFTHSAKDYYIKYSQMRRQQYQILQHIFDMLPNILPDTEENKILASMFGETAEQLDKENPGDKLLASIERLYEFFRKSELPKTREEFEGRAILYYMLLDFEKFLLLKRDFYEEYGSNNQAEDN